MAGERSSSYTIGFGGDSAEFDKVIASIKTSVSSAVAEIQRTTAKVELFADLKNSMPGVERALDSAKQRVQQLVAEITKIEAAGGKAPKELTQSLAQAERAVASASKELNNQTQKLNELHGALTKAGVDTNNLALAQQRLAVAQRAAADAAAIQAAKQQLGVVTLKDTSAEAQKLRLAFDRLKSSGTLSAQEITAAHRQLELKLRELDTTVTRTGGSIKNFHADSREMFTPLIGRVTAAVAAVGSVGAAMTSAITASSDYQRGLAELGAVTKLTREQQTALGAQVRDLAVELGVDLQSALKGAIELLRSGVPADNLVDTLRVSAEAAKAGVADLGDGVKAANVLMSGFGLTLEQLPRGFDTIITGAKNGGATISEFANTLGPLANVAKASNVSLEEVVATLGVMIDKGIDASTAASSLTQIIQKFGSPEVRGKIQELIGPFNGLVDAFIKLGQRGKGIEDLLALGIGNPKNAAAIAALTNGAQDLAKKFDGATTSIGATKTALDSLKDNPKEIQDKLNAALQETNIQLGETVGSGSKAAIAVTRILTAFNDLSPATKETGLAMGVFGGIFAPTILRMLDIIPAAAKVKGSLDSIKTPAQEAAAALEQLQTKIGVQKTDVDTFTKILNDRVAILLKAAAEERAAIDERVNTEIAALDKSLKANVDTTATTIAILKDAAKEKLRIALDTEDSIRAATKSAAEARLALGREAQEKQSVIDAAVTQIRITGNAQVLANYKGLYANLEQQARASADKLNAIERTRIDFGEQVADRQRAIRLEQLSSLGQYAEKQQEVDRLIAKGREVASTEGIAAAQKYFDKAISIAESVKGEVLSDGNVVISQFESQKKAIELIERASKAFNAELAKSKDSAKEGADGTKSELEFVERKIKDLSKEMQGLQKRLADGMSIKVDIDAITLNSARAQLNDLVKDREVLIRVRRIGALPGDEGTPQFVGPPAFNRGGYVPPWQSYAGGGDVFKRPAWQKVPGSGNTDTVPALLNVGSFVMRKAAVEKYGDGVMNRMVRGYAGGGFVGGGVRLNLPAGSAEDAKRIAQYISSLAPSEQNRLLDDLDSGGTTSAIAKSEILEGMATQARGKPTPVAPADINPTPSASDAAQYGRFIESHLKTGGIMDLVKKQIGTYIIQLEKNPNDEGLIQGLVRSARAAAANNFLEVVFGKSVFGGQKGGFANLPDWYDFIAAQSGENRRSRRNTGPAKKFFTGPAARQFADGGFAGPDTVPAMLTPGEFVLKPAAARAWGADLLHAMNNLQLAPSRVPRFATGGPVPGASVPTKGRFTGLSADGVNTYTFDVTINAAGGDLNDPRVINSFVDKINDKMRRAGQTFSLGSSR